MYGIKVVNGDFSVKGDGNVTEITGAERIMQELSHWLIEPLGTDTIYKRFGSTLWDSVGNPMLDEYINEVKSEVARVVSNYVAYQKRQINEDMVKGTDRFMRNWDYDDIIDRVVSIDVKALPDCRRMKQLPELRPALSKDMQAPSRRAARVLWPVF